MKYRSISKVQTNFYLEKFQLVSNFSSCTHWIFPNRYNRSNWSKIQMFYSLYAGIHFIRTVIIVLSYSFAGTTQFIRYNREFVIARFHYMYLKYSMLFVEHQRFKKLAITYGLGKSNTSLQIYSVYLCRLLTLGGEI